VDVSAKVDRLIIKVEGNGKKGLADEVEDINRRLLPLTVLTENLRLRSADNSNDPFAKLIRWFVDKIIPPLLVSLITAATMLVYLTINHVTFGN